MEKTPKGKKKESGSGRGRKKPPAEDEAVAPADTTNLISTTPPVKAVEKTVATPVKQETTDGKKFDSEFKISAPEISKEIKIELEDVKKLEKDELKKKKGKKEETTEKAEKEDSKEKEKKVDKGKGKGKKKTEPEEKEVKDESDNEKRTEKKVEAEKKKTKKKVKKKAEEKDESSDVVAAVDKVQQDDEKLDKSEKPEDSKKEAVQKGESDSVGKPLANVSSPKQTTPVGSSQEPKEVPGHSPRPNRDIHKAEDSVPKPIPETSTSSQQHHQLPSAVNLPSVPSHSGVFDPMALLAHVSSTAQAAATNTVFQNTPPDTPERSPHVMSHGGLSPEQDSSSLRSEGDAGMESEPTADPHSHHLPQGGESPATCDTSTLSNGSSAGSSGNLPSSESGTEAAPANSTAKRKATAHDEEEEDEEESDLKPAKKKKRGHKRQSHGTAGQPEKTRGSSKHHHHHPHHHSSKFSHCLTSCCGCQITSR